MRLGLFFNPHYPQQAEVIARLEQLRAAHGLELWALREQNDILPPFIKRTTPRTAGGLGLEAILVFGGDGTMLRSAPFSLASGAPLLGVNLGRLGFLSDIQLSELEKAILALSDGKYASQERMLLKAVLKRNGKTIYDGLALNDAVIYKGRAPTLVDIRIYCNRRFVVDTRCDGVVAATPTGSTAYSLSAGGPILSPVMDAIIVSPLNPHILTVRPMVFGPDDRLSFRVHHAQDNAVLQLDGRNVIDLEAGDALYVSRSPRKLRFVKLGSKTFYQLLRHKLHMGKRNRP